jgi:UDP-N-acetylmuramate dehydrogenase
MLSRLAAIPGLSILENVPLARYTRFSVGGPARILADASTERALAEAIRILRETGEPHTVIGGGTNLVVADAGFPGVVLRYVDAALTRDETTVTVAAGAVLQNLVDFSIAAGLRGLETMTGIPGWVGGAVYGNAGAYGHSLQEYVTGVRYFDGEHVREIDHAACGFHYRESIFKRHKDWIVLSATLRLAAADPHELQAIADGILKIRNQKYPPSMCCAGSIFKNLLWEQLPASLQARIPRQFVREGKVPSAYFLEQAGGKGLVNGGVRVADYHANLIYNEGGGTARQVHELIAELKRRVREVFDLELEEEVQFIPPLSM